MQKISIALAATLLTFACLPSWHASAQEQGAQEAIQQLLGEEKYAEARPLIEKSLREDTTLTPNQRAGLLFGLAFSLIELDEYRASINTWHRMIVLVPRHPLVWGNLGWAYYLEGDLDSAIVANELAISFDDEQAWLWGNEGLYMLAKGDMKRMEEAYGNVVSYVADPDAWEMITGDVDEYCVDESREGCAEVRRCLEKGWRDVLLRWYQAADSITGEELVSAYRSDYEQLLDIVGERASESEGEEHERLEKLRERLAKDLK